MTPAELRALIAASDEAEETVFVRNEDRILSAAFDALIPKPAKICDTDPYSQTPEYQDWCRLQARFIELSRSPIEAALFIAETVLPGCAPESRRFRAILYTKNPARRHVGQAKIRWLAIIDALCAAVERKEETNG